MSAYRNPGVRDEYNDNEGDKKMERTIIRWVGITVITFIIAGFGTCITVNVHHDNAEMGTMPMQLEKSKADAEKAKAEADKEMWARMK